VVQVDDGVPVTVTEPADERSANCGVCAKPFIKKRSNSQFCSPECRNQYWTDKVPSTSEPVPTDKPTVIATPPIILPPVKAKTISKTCEACGKSFMAKRPDVSYCYDSECKKARAREYARAHYKPKVGTIHEQPAKPTKAFILPKRVVEPIEYFKDKRFTDPWNCQACRDYEQPCRLHKALEADGKRPPVRAPYF